MKVNIGCAHRRATPPRVARTLEDAFGPGARLEVDRRDPDRYVGWMCAAILAVCLLGLLIERLA